MSDFIEYEKDVQVIKNAILHSQYDAVKSVNEKQLMLYFGIGKYISLNSRNGAWGKGAIDAISDRLDKELPGLRGFSARNLRYMRAFYEEWKMLDKSSEDILALTSAKNEDGSENEIWHLQVPNLKGVSIEDFLSIGFTQHRTIFEKVKDIDERCFYIRRCAEQKYSVEALRASIKQDEYHHQGALPNNFMNALTSEQQALRAINTFKDEYLLDYINVEELSVRDKQDIDERVIENVIIHNVKNFILKFGKDFTFVRNQYHLDAFGERPVYRSFVFQQRIKLLSSSRTKKGQI